MKLIRFGSFPLVQIKKEEHNCLDNYLLKHFSDSISFSNAITNLSIMQNTFYITPEKVITALSNENGSKGSKFNRRNSNETAQQLNGSKKNKNGDYNNYLDSTKRAFKILKMFYTQLADAPFYKGMVYYPIYMEKYVRDSSSNNTIQSQYKFNFILLTNNLIDTQVKDLDIDEAAVTNILYIFIHLFKSDVLFNEVSKSTEPISFSSFNQKNLVQVMKFYKLIQKFDLNPVTVFLAIYDLVSFSKQEVQSGNTPNFNNFASRLSSRTVNNFNPDDSKFRGIVKVISTQISLELQTLKSANEFSSTEIILKIVETMLNHNEIKDFVVNLNSKNYSRDTRMELVADFNHYQPIIKIFEKLAAFNKLSLKDIIQDHDINFNKDIVLSGNTDEANLTTIRGAIDAPLFDESYKNWQDSCMTFITNTIKTLIDKQLTKEVNSFYNFKKDPEYIALMNNLNNVLDSITTKNAELKRASYILNSMPGGNDVANVTPAVLDARKKVTKLFDEVDSLKKERLKLDNDKIVITTSITALAQNTATKITSKLDEGFNTLVPAFGNIYEDLSNIFLNPMMMNLFFTNADVRKLFDLGGNSFNLNCMELEPSLINFSEVKLKIKSTSAIESQSLEVLDSLIQQLTVDIRYLLDMYLNLISENINTNLHEVTVDSRRRQDPLRTALSAGDYSNLINGFLGDCYRKLCNFIFKPMLLKVSRLQIREQNELQYSNDLNDLHPVLGKMARNINNFKSFIFGVTTLETLYDLIVLTKEKLFYNGLLNRPIQRLNTTDAKIKYILNVVLGLSQNTIWVVGGGKVRLSMPDYLSITGIPFTSDIKQNQLRSICKLDPKKWWSEFSIGKDYDFSKKSMNADTEKKALVDAQKELDKNKNAVNAAKVKKARENLTKKLKQMENNVDNGLGNIGLNITKISRENFFGAGGLGDDVINKTKSVISSEEYLLKTEELRNQGLGDEEIEEKLDKEFAIFDQDSQQLMQQIQPMQQPYMQQPYTQQPYTQQMPMQPNNITMMRQQMQNNPSTYINDYSRRPRS